MFSCSKYKVKIISILNIFIQIKGWKWDYYIIPGYIHMIIIATQQTFPRQNLNIAGQGPQLTQDQDWKLILKLASKLPLYKNIDRKDKCLYSAFSLLYSNAQKFETTWKMAKNKLTYFALISIKLQMELQRATGRNESETTFIAAEKITWL